MVKALVKPSDNHPFEEKEIFWQSKKTKSPVPIRLASGKFTVGFPPLILFVLLSRPHLKVFWANSFWLCAQESLLAGLGGLYAELDGG